MGLVTCECDECVSNNNVLYECAVQLIFPSYLLFYIYSNNQLFNNNIYKVVSHVHMYVYNLIIKVMLITVSVLLLSYPRVLRLFLFK